MQFSEEPHINTDDHVKRHWTGRGCKFKTIANASNYCINRNEYAISSISKNNHQYFLYSFSIRWKIMGSPWVAYRIFKILSAWFLSTFPMEPHKNATTFSLQLRYTLWYNVLFCIGKNIPHSQSETCFHHLYASTISLYTKEQRNIILFGRLALGLW